MKRAMWMWVAVGMLFVLGEVAGALEGVKPYQIINRLRLEYDDNVYEEETDKNGSWKFIEEIELLLNYRLEQSFLSIRYKPSLIWWENRPSDDFDMQHEFDFILNHVFTPRLALNVMDTLRRGENPELTDRDVIVREEDDFWYNTANATVSYLFRPETRLDVAGRYTLMQYDREEAAETEDFDLLVGGLTLRHQLLPETALMGDLRLEDISYEGPDRGSQSFYVGAGAEHAFSPNLLTSLSGGYQEKQYNAETLDSESSPYVDLTLTIVPTPATRLTLGGGYSLFETDVYPYANQARTRVYASLAHDFTARVSFYLSGGYTDGQYEAEDSIITGLVSDGNEEIVLVSARATYRLNRSNWLEAGWQYQDFQSDLQDSAGNDLRESYERNRISIGWKVQL